MANVRERFNPQYDLAAVQDRVNNPGIELTRRVEKYIARYEWTTDDVKRRITELQEQDYYKSQEHERIDDLWLDIYIAEFSNPEWANYEPYYEDRPTRLYIKFFIGQGGEVMVYSFKWA